MPQNLTTMEQFTAWLGRQSQSVQDTLRPLGDNIAGFFQNNRSLVVNDNGQVDFSGLRTWAAGNSTVQSVVNTATDAYNRASSAIAGSGAGGFFESLTQGMGNNMWALIGGGIAALIGGNFLGLGMFGTLLLGLVGAVLGSAMGDRENGLMASFLGNNRPDFMRAPDQRVGLARALQPGTRRENAGTVTMDLIPHSTGNNNDVIINAGQINIRDIDQARRLGVSAPTEVDVVARGTVANGTLTYSELILVNREGHVVGRVTDAAELERLGWAPQPVTTSMTGNRTVSMSADSWNSSLNNPTNISRMIGAVRPSAAATPSGPAAPAPASGTPPIPPSAAPAFPGGPARPAITLQAARSSQASPDSYSMTGTLGSARLTVEGRLAGNSFTIASGDMTIDTGDGNGARNITLTQPLVLTLPAGTTPANLHSALQNALHNNSQFRSVTSPLVTASVANPIPGLAGVLPSVVNIPGMPDQFNTNAPNGRGQSNEPIL